MSSRVSTLLAALALLIGGPLLSEARAADVTIAAVEEQAQAGDLKKGEYLALEGKVVRRSRGDLYLIDDGTGSIWVRIPESVRRAEGEPADYERIRVFGKYTHAYLDDGTWGIAVSTLKRNLEQPSRSPKVDGVPTVGGITN